MFDRNEVINSLLKTLTENKLQYPVVETIRHAYSFRSVFRVLVKEGFPLGIYIDMEDGKRISQEELNKIAEVLIRVREIFK